MSTTATTFWSLGSFPYDIVGAPPDIDPSTPPGAYGEGMWIGPYGITAAMSIYWSLEESTVSADSEKMVVTYWRGVGGSPYTQRVPSQRVSYFPQFGYTSPSLTARPYDKFDFQIFPEMGKSGSYYYFLAEVDVFRWEVGYTGDDRWLTTNWSGAVNSDWTVVATFNRPIYGANCVFTRQKATAITVFTGSDNVAVTAAYYTYPS